MSENTQDPATDRNVPARSRARWRRWDVREGMLGASGSGDASGYGGLVTPSDPLAARAVALLR